MPPLYMVFMGNTILDWLVLDYKGKGLKDKDKRFAVYNKIEESGAAVVCLEETKCENFDRTFIKGFYPKRFN
jgi:hypothetical protein